MPVNAIAMLRYDAPARMNMIMHETRVADIRLSTKLRQVSEPLHHAIASEPSTPYAAHSVAVATPATSTQTMKMMSALTGIRFPDLRTFSMKLIGGPGGGRLSGFAVAQAAAWPGTG